ncbi:hypothetical protein JOF53_000292 [Crossiella equi]|uniref:Uncharacterized protein n=1 Tax=Crossiella equi TaxID=130796 RepID=A0ABS5A4C0_9PSEU|nr:hypothetical protein [Crossiella equi]MBP2471420.1 hypothetical protein [Crossiella equi]
MLEIATGSAVGTGGPDGLTAGRAHRFPNVRSGHCLDGAGAAVVVQPPRAADLEGGSARSGQGSS